MKFLLEAFLVEHKQRLAKRRATPEYKGSRFRHGHNSYPGKRSCSV